MDRKKWKETHEQTQNSSKNASNNVLNNGKDSRILLNIFPEEIWQIILTKYCQNPELESIGNTSLFFRDLLFQNRVIFLFPSVWKVLGAQYLKKYTTDEAYNEATLNKKHMRLCDINSCRCRGVPKWYSGILKLRLICKAWCLSVNKFLNVLDETTETSHIISTRVYLVIEFAEYFMSSNYTFDETITLFSKILYLQFGINHPNGYTKQCLEKFGIYFTKCFFAMFDVFDSRVEFYGAFREIVELLPNLTHLETEYVRLLYTPGNVREYVPETSDTLAQLNREITLNPLKPLENLQTFSTKRLLSPFFHEFVRVAPNISNLRIQIMSTEKADNEIAYQQLNLQKVDTFYIHIDSSARIQNLEETAFIWPLKNLEVGFDENVLIGWPRVFSLLEDKWGNLQTLTSLKITMPSTNNTADLKQIVQWSKQCELNLKNLQNLEIVMRNFHTIDFILPTSDKLESLKIHINFDVDEVKRNQSQIFNEVKKTQVIQFHGYATRYKMIQSNIWKLFPQLKRICCSYYCEQRSWSVTREQYTKWAEKLICI